MTKDNKLLIIIPAFNEENTIKKVLLDLKETLKINNIYEKSEILVINDFSNDNTRYIVEQQGVNIINNFSHLGYCGSLQVGYRYALKNNFNYLIQMDADGQHDPNNIIDIYFQLVKNQYDIIIGSRFLSDQNLLKVSVAKKIAIWYFKKIIKFATKKVVSDPTSGLQGLTKPVMFYYSKYNQFDDRYPDSNILIEAILAGFSYKEIPAIMYNRNDGKSMHYGLKSIYYMLHTTLATFSAWTRKDLKRKYSEAKMVYGED